MRQNPLSVAEQQTITSTAKIAVSHFIYQLFGKNGMKSFFTQTETEDIVGDTIYKACRSIDGFDPEKGKLSTWIYQIAFRCVLDAYNYKMKRVNISCPMTAISQEDGDEYNASETSKKKSGLCLEMNELLSRNEADTDINFKEFENRIQKKVGKLSDINQRFFEYFAEMGLAPREIAALEGCTPNAAAKRVHDIRQCLKPSLANLAHIYDIHFGKID